MVQYDPSAIVEKNTGIIFSVADESETLSLRRVPKLMVKRRLWSHTNKTLISYLARFMMSLNYIK